MDAPACLDDASVLLLLENTMRAEQIDGARMTTLARNKNGPAEMAALMMKRADPNLRVHPAAQPLLEAVARVVLERWLSSNVDGGA